MRRRMNFLIELVLAQVRSKKVFILHPSRASILFLMLYHVLREEQNSSTTLNLDGRMFAAGLLREILILKCGKKSLAATLNV